MYVSRPAVCLAPPGVAHYLDNASRSHISLLPARGFEEGAFCTPTSGVLVLKVRRRAANEPMSALVATRWSILLCGCTCQERWPSPTLLTSVRWLAVLDCSRGGRTCQEDWPSPILLTSGRWPKPKHGSLPVAALLRALRRAARGLCRGDGQATGRRLGSTI